MSKIYYHRTPGAKFYMPDGKEVCFAGGFFDTKMVEDEEQRVAAEKELDKIANVPASHIYTMDNAPLARDEGEPLKELMESATSGFDHVNKVPAGTVTHAMPSQQDQKPTLNPVRSAVAAAANAAADAQTPKPATPIPTVNDKLAAARAAIANSQTAAANAQASGGSAHTPVKTP